MGITMRTDAVTSRLVMASLRCVTGALGAWSWCGEDHGATFGRRAPRIGTVGAGERGDVHGDDRGVGANAPRESAAGATGVGGVGTTDRRGPSSQDVASQPMWRLLLVVLLAGCGSGSDDKPVTLDTRSTTTVAEVDWLDQFEPFTSVEEIDGHTVGIMADDRVIYVQDCDVAETLTAEGGRFGPGPRDPETLDYEPGYGSVCE